MSQRQAASTRGTSREQLEAVVREYFDGCNEADAAKLIGCLAPDAMHYFPDGASHGPFRSAQEIADGWRQAVATLGSRWTIDRMLCDERRREVAIEWTHFKTGQELLLRGSELYCFDEDGLITEIRAYYAAPAASPPRSHELGGFDYARAGYPTRPPSPAPAVARR